MKNEDQRNAVGADCIAREEQADRRSSDERGTMNDERKNIVGADCIAGGGRPLSPALSPLRRERESGLDGKHYTINIRHCVPDVKR